MSIEYRHIKQYENEIFRLKSEGLIYQQIGDHLGFERIKVKQFFERQCIREKNLRVGKNFFSLLKSDSICKMKSVC